MIEVLVAIVILAVITIPLMHAFLTSANTNAKAKKIAQAVTIAQNTMEKIYADDLDDLLADSEEKSLIDEISLHKTIIYTHDYGKQTIDGVTYETVAEFTADSNGDGTPEITDYNQKEIAQLFSMNTDCDAIYLQPDDLDVKMAKEFSGDLQTVLRQMERNISATISKDGEMQQVEIEIAYTWNGETRQAFSQKQCIYRQSTAEETMRNIYLFYSPLEYTGTLRETIRICNEALLPVSVYVVRQSETVSGLDTYKMKLEVLEPERADEDYVLDVDSVETSPLQVRTAVRTNLPWKTETENGVAVYQQMLLYYGTEEWNLDEKKEIVINGTTRECRSEELTGLKGLAAETAEDRVYKVVVKVYEEGKDKSKDEPLASLDGAKTK